jgi:hypothetical protein
MKNFGPQKAHEAPLLGIGDEIERWNPDSIAVILKLQ